MIKEYFDPFWFIISLAIGLLLVYISTPSPEIVYQYPTPENCNNSIYADDANNCYKYKAKRVSCPKNEENIKVVPIQKVDMEEKEKEGIFARFQEMVNSKPKETPIVIPN